MNDVFDPDETDVSNSTMDSNATDWTSEVETKSSVAPVSRNVLFFIGVYLTFVGLASTFGNSIFAIVLRRRLRALCDGQTILLLNVAICDLGISITGYPYTTVSAYVGRWIWGDTMCRVSGFLCFTLNEVQMNTLVFIAIFRYVTVCHAEFRHMLTNDLAKKCVAIAWLYSIFWTAPPLIGWSRYILEPYSVSCSTDWHDRSPSGIAYSVCLVVFCYVVQVALLVLCYHGILTKSRKLQLRHPETNPKLYLQNEEEFVQPYSVKCFDCICICETSFQNGVEKHVLMMNLLMVVSFLVFWTPYAIISLISIFKKDLKIFWYIFPTIFAKTSCMMNPIIYGLSHKLIRRELFRFLRNYCCNNREAAKREYEESQKRVAEGSYDKEGIYVGKVKVGLCACNGCVIGRREMAVLARLQKSPVTRPLSSGENGKNSEVSTCAITLVDDQPSNNGHEMSQRTPEGKERGDKDDRDEVSMVEVIMSPKVWPTCSSRQQEQESAFKNAQDDSINSSEKSEYKVVQKRKTSLEDDLEETSLETPLNDEAKQIATTLDGNADVEDGLIDSHVKLEMTNGASVQNGVV
ncbi:visual pigment-like receptor peropsin isoform X2 [Palaemon carinicauda]|uniref:visual pigment-like receptor peropsin isoform X2 n=1 Tax=Palaemon carinicauda TaxID=392227 RepID=UPI0035B6A7F7